MLEKQRDVVVLRANGVAADRDSDPFYPAAPSSNYPQLGIPLIGPNFKFDRPETPLRINAAKLSKTA